MTNAEGMLEENLAETTELNVNEVEMSDFAVVVGATSEDAGIKLSCWNLNEVL